MLVSYTDNDLNFYFDKYTNLLLQVLLFDTYISTQYKWYYQYAQKLACTLQTGMYVAVCFTFEVR